MNGPAGEMPFLDHLEELRGRLLKSLLAIAVGFGVGLWIVQRFTLVSFLKIPIAPYLATTGGKLTVHSPTEPVLIVFKLGFIVGLVLASPVILFQLWAFLSPALYAKERRAVLPALLIGLLLFLVGAGLGWVFVVPQALRVLFSFQSDALALLITYNEYFDFVVQIMLALGISFELPLVMILLSALGILSPSAINRFRRFAIILACVAGALLSPGTDVISMIMMTLPLILLYEVGFAGSVIIHRRRLKRDARAAAVGVIFLCLLTPPGHAQQPVPPRRPGAPTAGVPLTRADSLHDSIRTRGVNQPLDTATARRLGLPTAPRQTFAAPDSLLKDLLARKGYEITRYRSDSATLLADERKILLDGAAMTERGGTTLEADAITYQESSCSLKAEGDPHLFDRGTVLVGDGIRYDTCVRRGVVTGALTNFQEGGTVWFLRGNLAQDSTASRLYAASSEITSCNLPVPHYHFTAKEVKWISKNVMVARPAILYIRDVPVLWLPFVFQDARPKRHSGILIPQFGLNDLVRPYGGYNRQVTNIGYYWAPSDYFDVTGRFDWYAGRYVQLGFSGQYHWLNRFMTGSVAYSRQQNTGGGNATGIRWNHQQNFNLSTTLNLDLNYITSSSIVQGNSVDPILSTRQIQSALHFSKRYHWGTLSIGGRRSQSITDKSVTQTLPAVTISPKPFDLSSSISWSPGLSFTNDIATRQPIQSLLLLHPVTGAVDTIPLTADSRTTALSFDTPFRFGGFNWRNSLRYIDVQKTGRQVVSFNVPDTTTGVLNDSLKVTRIFNGDFSSDLDWDTGINLPTLFRGSWKLQPAVGIANTTSGSFFLRNRNTNGNWVHQGKRFSFTLGVSPSFFGFFPGFGPISRIRHNISPVLSYNYSPAASIPLEYARAVVIGAGAPVITRSIATQTASIALSQNFEAKRKPAPGDTTDQTQARKIRLLSIATSPLSYDFEQAKQPGRTGWRTQTITNTFQSELVPGFNLSLTHDLWRGTAGSDTAQFNLFLTNVSASFAVSGATFRGLAAALGLGGKTADSGAKRKEEPPPTSYAGSLGRSGRSSFYNTDQAFLGGGSRGRFTASFNYQLQRSRPDPTATGVVPSSRQSLGIQTSFSPTRFWNVSWRTQYNITDKRFESNVVTLTRDLHEWRAGFDFSRSPNGNFAFFFHIALTDLPEIKFDYNQTTLQR